jgi:hypothetical protein
VLGELSNLASGEHVDKSWDGLRSNKRLLDPKRSRSQSLQARLPMLQGLPQLGISASIVGRAILPAAAFSGGFFRVANSEERAEARLQPRLSAPQFLQTAHPNKSMRQ